MDLGVPFGSARLHLLPGAVVLNEDVALFEAMLSGWSAQQVGGRNLQARTVEGRLNQVRLFQRHADSYPWLWTAAQFDEWMTDLVAVRKLASTSIRGYQLAVRQFCDFVCSPHYGWVAECEQRFGSHPVQVCHDWNTRVHVQDYEGDPRRRPLTREELQRLFDHADKDVEVRLAMKRKAPRRRTATRRC
ncbi:hypothetical protein [Microbacterium sp. dk485]|uniref:hypothetical protein n=1 Tax=Microbacterium sp. dk485 TaxID=2560021 RepID=UPI001FD7C582|nr:hypothetical protein [Microbacterium sp. dk485]